jgi:tetratricopeptide (TPR) repeat protein
MRATLLTALSVVLWASPAFAQTYPMNTPVPRTTSVPALRNAAVAREVEERFKIGLDALSRSDWKSATSEFERVLVLNPPEPKGSTAHYDLAIAQANLGNNDDAARNLRAAIALDPGFLAAMANLVAVDLARGDLKEARAVADRFLALSPESARALYSRGLVALKDGDSQTARDDFGKLLQTNPSYAVAHYDLALAEEPAARGTQERSQSGLRPGHPRCDRRPGAREYRRGDARFDRHLEILHNASLGWQ